MSQIRNETRVGYQRTFEFQLVKLEIAVMAATVADLPIDILLEIFKHLSIQQTTRLGQTCKSLHNASNERAVWAEKNSDLYTQLPPIPSGKMAYDDLRKKVVQDAIINTRWREAKKGLDVFGRVSSDFGSNTQYVELLPGGDHVLFISSDGALDIKSIAIERGETHSLKFFEPEPWEFTFQVSEYFLCPISAQDGHVLLEMQYEEEDLLQLLVYRYRVDALSINTSVVANFALDPQRTIHRWASNGTKFGYIYLEDVAPLTRTCVSFFNLPLDSGVEVTETPPEATFQLSDPNFDNSDFSLCGFSMITKTRFVTAGVSSPVSVYDLPQDACLEDDSGQALVVLSPIWVWPGAVAPNFPIFQCSPICYTLRNPESAFFWLSEGYASVHYLEISTTGGPAVRSCHTVECKLDRYPALGCGRGLWCSELEGIGAVSTLTVSDPPVIGSFEFKLENGWELLTEHASFDDTSGRVIFLVRDSSGQHFVLVGDIADVH